MARPTGLEPATNCLEVVYGSFKVVGFEAVDVTGRQWMSLEMASERHQILRILGRLNTASYELQWWHPSHADRVDNRHDRVECSKKTMSSSRNPY